MARQCPRKGFRMCFMRCYAPRVVSAEWENPPFIHLHSEGNGFRAFYRMDWFTHTLFHRVPLNRWSIQILTAAVHYHHWATNFTLLFRSSPLFTLLFTEWFNKSNILLSGQSRLCWHTWRDLCDFTRLRNARSTTSDWTLFCVQEMIMAWDTFGET